MDGACGGHGKDAPRGINARISAIRPARQPHMPCWMGAKCVCPDGLATETGQDAMVGQCVRCWVLLLRALGLTFPRITLRLDVCVDVVRRLKERAALVVGAGQTFSDRHFFLPVTLRHALQ